MRSIFFSFQRDGPVLREMHKLGLSISVIGVFVDTLPLKIDPALYCQCRQDNENVEYRIHVLILYAFWRA